MRYIFTAAVCTLCAITALLALPPIGGPHAQLVAQTHGDRNAIVETGNDDAPSPRQVVTPANSTAPSTNVLGDVELALSDAPGDTPADPVTALEEIRSLAIEADEDSVGAGSGSTSTTSSTTTTTAAPETTTTTTTSTTTTTEAPPTTTEAPPTTTAASVDSDEGVIISERGVVLPVIGRASAGGWRALTPCGNEVTLDSGERVTSVDFVIDPGHGGIESGAVGPNGATEKALNLRVSEIVKWYLEEAGYSVLLTRTSDIRIPLKSRASIANALQPKAFVSVHHNGGATRVQSEPGTELFVDAGNPESRRLGGILFEEITDRLSGYNAQWVGTWRNGVSARLNSEGADLYGIHRYTPDVVSVITEAGYLSNASEALLYVDNDVQWSHGRAIAEGLMRWDRSGDSGSGFLDDFTDDSSSGTGGFTGCIDPKL